MSYDGPDAKELKEILGVVSTEIPKLLESISNMIYNKDNAENFGKSVAVFYKQMVDAGMDQKQAFELTQKYMANFSMGGMLGQVMGGAVRHGMDKDLDDEVGKKIKAKIMKKLDEDDGE
jgi:hypothetical protein